VVLAVEFLSSVTIRRLRRLNSIFECSYSIIVASISKSSSENQGHDLSSLLILRMETYLNLENTDFELSDLKEDHLILHLREYVFTISEME